MKSIVLSLLVLSVGCVKKGNLNNEAKPQEILDHKFSGEQATAIQLSRVPTGITHTVSKFAIDGIEADFNKFHYSVKFPSLNEAQFNQLKSIYSGWSDAPSQVVFIPNRPYLLTDFLPLAIQATVGKRFKDQFSPVPMAAMEALGRAAGNIGNVTTDTNCWAIAYEVTRQSNSSLAIFNSGEVQTKNVFENKKIIEFEQELTPNNAKLDAAANRNRDLKPGDVLFVYRVIDLENSKNKAELLKHVAVYLDNDFYFERTGPGSELAYRLVHYSDIVGRYNDDGSTANFKYAVRRYEKNAFKHPSQVFSISAQFPDRVDPSSKAVLDGLSFGMQTSKFEGVTNNESLATIRDFKFIFDTVTKRASLEPAAGLQESFATSEF